MCIRDRPYEETASDLERALAAIAVILARLANAVIALWYPIKDLRDLAPWLLRATAQATAPTLNAQLWVHPTDSRVALNGSGILIVNPPHQVREHMQIWLPQLTAALSAEPAAGSRAFMLAESAA